MMSNNFSNTSNLQAKYIDVESMPWQRTKFPGIEMKILYSDKESGISSILFKMAPGAVVPKHTHMALEQTFMLEGSLADDQGSVTKGNFVWRPAGNSHIATAPDGAVFLSLFLKPNVFDEGHAFFRAES